MENVHVLHIVLIFGVSTVIVRTDCDCDLNSGGPREGGCVEGLRDDAPLSGIGAIGVPR